MCFVNPDDTHLPSVLKGSCKIIPKMMKTKNMSVFFWGREWGTASRQEKRHHKLTEQIMSFQFFAMKILLRLSVSLVKKRISSQGDLRPSTAATGYFVFKACFKTKIDLKPIFPTDDRELRSLSQRSPFWFFTCSHQRGPSNGVQGLDSQSAHLSWI